MKKILLSLAIISTNFIFAQITLENSFSINETVFVYKTDSELYYISETKENNTLKIYNSDFTTYKTVNIPVSTDYQCSIWYDSDRYPLISKHIFNIDNKFEFLVSAYNGLLTKLLLIDDDGNLIYDFNTNADYSFGNYYEIFHDPIENKNKFIVRNVNNVNYNIRYDVYDLPTATLSTSEIQLVDFVAFPNPTSKKLSLINPKNGNTSIEIYDLNGKKVLHKTFSDLEDKISIDVEKLSNGVYVYKIGSLSSKFIKN